MGHAGCTPYADWAERLIKAGVTILDEPYLMTRGRNDRSRIWFVPEELYSLDLKGLETTYTGVLGRLRRGRQPSPPIRAAPESWRNTRSRGREESRNRQDDGGG